MQHLRTVDFEAVANAGADERVVQRLLDHSNGARTCTMSCIRTPAGAGSPEGLHTHAVDQLFYILSGVMSIEVAGEAFEAGPSSLVVFPAGVPHRNWNAGSEATIHLAISAPVPDPSVPFATPAR